MATKLPLSWLEADYDQDSVAARCHPLTICDALNSDVANVYSEESTSGPKLTHDEAAAYARLFVAAPDLLQALRDIVAGLTPNPHTGLYRMRRAVAVDIARTAIAKAEGAR